VGDHAGILGAVVLFLFIFFFVSFLLLFLFFCDQFEWASQIAERGVLVYLLNFERDIVPWFATPHVIWLQDNLRVGFASLEGGESHRYTVIEEAESLHLGLLSSRDK
jgi:hypothetical protein